MIQIFKIFSLALIVYLSISFTSAGYILENGSKNLIKQYDLSDINSGSEISRGEFVDILYKLYIVYKKDRGVNIDYTNYTQLDNSKIFTDIKLESGFGKKLSYFTHIGAFAKNEKFNTSGKVSQKDFFTVMRRLKIMNSLQQCKKLKICEKELDSKFSFTKGIYLKYWSKILDKELRKYYSSAQDYIDSGYKASLSSKYNFPIKGQTLNGCYAFSIRNITKFKHGIGMRIPAMERYMEKPGEKLWNSMLMKNFDKIAHIKRKNFSHIDTIINSLQAGDPLAISYYLEYFSYKENKEKKILHIVSAYSFDEVGLWVSETVTARRLRVPWNQIFNAYGNTKNNRIFRYEYQPKDTWTKEELELEMKYNFLVGEY